MSGENSSSAKESREKKPRALDIAEVLRNGGADTLGRQLRLTLSLSLPSVFAQLSTIVMEYIDASMVGSLGAEASASIGIVSTMTWLFWGIGSAIVAGFSVHAAHLIGADKDDSARRIVGQAIFSVGIVAVALGLVGWGISGRLPVWLGGDSSIVPSASSYFRIFSLGLPVLFMNFLAGSLLRCSGNTLIPGILNVAMCVLDVVFNWFLIFPSRDILVMGVGITVPGAGLGVSGAALGTVCAEVVTASLMMYYLLRKSRHLNMRKHLVSFIPRRETLRRALKISLPMGTEHIIMCGAQIFLTIIVAPLGTVAIAANAFAITAESLCYTPGFGVADAATTLVGQTIGAGRRNLTRRFAYITMGMGIGIMTVMGLAMYLAAPMLMEIFTPVQEVRDMGVMALRIEAFAEPMYAASIVAYGVFVGAGDTLVPSMMNLVSIWGVRIPLAAWLAGTMGLKGVWIAMCIELCFRGGIFLWRLLRNRWIHKATNLSHIETKELEQPINYYEL